MAKHRWLKEHDHIAFYLYYKKIKSEKVLIKSANIIGCPVSSLKMRISNYSYLDKGTGLKNYSILSKNVYDELINDESSRKKVFEHVETLIY